MMEWAFWYFPLGRLSPRLPAPTGIRGTEAKCRGRHSEGLCLQTEVQEPRLLLPSGEPVHFRQVITKMNCLCPDQPIRPSHFKQVDRSVGHRHQRLRGVRLDAERLWPERSWRSFAGRVHCVLIHSVSAVGVVQRVWFHQKPNSKCCVVPHTTLEIR